MSTRTFTALGVAVAAAGIVTSSLISPVASAAPAPGTGTLIEAVDKGDCNVEFTLTNHTNSTNYWPDWWFESENPPASYPPSAPSAGAQINPPWRMITGVPWPIARYVGNPPLKSGIPAGVAPWGSGPAYSSDLSKPPYGGGPDGPYEPVTTTATINLRDATDPAMPTPAADGTQKIFYRIALGPVTKDRDQDPKELTVTGCGSGGGDGSSTGSLGSSTGSLDSGSLGSGSLGSGSLGSGSLGSGSLSWGSLDSGSLDLGSLFH